MTHFDLNEAGALTQGAQPEDKAEQTCLTEGQSGRSGNMRLLKKRMLYAWPKVSVLHTSSACVSASIDFSCIQVQELGFFLSK